MSAERIAELEALVAVLQKNKQSRVKKLREAARWITASVTHMEAIVKENQQLKTQGYDADAKKSLAQGEEQTVLLREIRDLLKVAK